MWCRTLTLDDAIRHGEKLLKTKMLRGADAAAVTVLVEMAKRVRRLQEPLRQVERGLCPPREPTAHLNQQELFGTEDGGSSG